MMTIGRNLIIGALAMLMISSCQQKIDSLQSFYKVLGDKKNGLIIEREINGIKIKMKYLPAEFLAMKESKDSPGDYNIALKDYEETSTFVVNFSAADNDIMFSNVETKEDYNGLFQELNFHFDKYVKLAVGDQKYLPVLFNLENTYELKKDKTVYMVFPIDVRNAKSDVDIILDDQFFGTGISHFGFSNKNITNVSELVAL